MKRFPSNLHVVLSVVVLIWAGDFAIRALVARADHARPTAPATSSSTTSSSTTSSSTPSRGGSRGTDPTCPEGTRPVSHRFATGGEWQMCWRIEAHQGLVLSNIVYTAPNKPPLPVIEELALSQLEVPYDTGDRMTRDITDHGFGGRNMKTLGGSDCVGERIAVAIPNFGTGAVGDTETREVLCSDEVDAGLGRRSTWGGHPISQRGRSFQLSTVSVVGWYEYMTLYSFGENGEVTPRLGATGDLSPEDFTDDDKHGSPVGSGHTHEGAASHTHNAVWRIHWALGGKHGVQEYNADFSGEKGHHAAVIDGTWTTMDHEVMRLYRSRRWWRVIGPNKNADGHSVSYKIQLDGVDDYTPHAHTASDSAGHHGPGDGDAAFGYDVAFSQYQPCERFATKNFLARCPTNDVPAFVADHQELSDVVSWVAVSFHHVPRDEDQSPMDVHWQGFSMYPFDAFAQNPLTPPDRAAVNGKASTTPGAH